MGDKIKTLRDNLQAANDIVDVLVSRVADLKKLFIGAVSMPAEAEAAVEEIFEEVEKTVAAIDEATRAFATAARDPAALLDDIDRISDLSGSALPTLVEEKRGHCDRIADLDWQYLNGWLTNFFPGSQEKSDAVRDILNELRNADNNLFDGLKQAALAMRDVARAAYRSDVGGQRQEAAELLREAALPVLDLRDTFNDALVRMAEIKRDFVKTRRARTG